jgi:hypothetical protein
MKTRYATELEHRDVNDFSSLSTTLEKSQSPAWYFSHLNERRGRDPKILQGVVLDWDSEDLSSRYLDSRYEYHIHRTHSGGWRIIVPFARVIETAKFESATDLFEEVVAKIFKGVNHEALDRGCYSYRRCFHFRPVGHKLVINSAPKLAIKERIIRRIGRGEGRLGGEVRVDNVKLPLKVLVSRVERFYCHYKHVLRLDKLGIKKCCMNWHKEGKEGDIAFNSYNRTIPAFIHCYHSTCKKKIKEVVSDKINFTVGYLSLCIHRGIFSLVDLESVAFNERMVKHIGSLSHLNYSAKLDCATWILILYEHVFLRQTDESIYAFNGKNYEILSKARFRDELQYSAGTYYSYRIGKGPSRYVNELIEYSYPILRQNEEDINFSNDGICLKNGILLIQGDGNHSFVPHNFKYFFAETKPYSYDERKSCPKWTAIMEEYFGGNGRLFGATLQEFFGYCLTSSRSFEKFLVLYGVTRSGKNTIIETLLKLVPGASMTLSLLSHAKERQSIVGKNVIFVNEALVSGASRTTSELKKLTSTDPIVIRPLYGAAYDTIAIPKIVLSFNSPPENLEIDEALGSRMLVIKMINSFKGRENINLKTELSEELSGILNWALEGYRRLCKNGRFSGTVDSFHDLYISLNPSQELEAVSNFVRRHGTGTIKTSILYSEFEKGWPNMGIRNFTGYLKELGYMSSRKTDGIYYHLT